MLARDIFNKRVRLVVGIMLASFIYDQWKHYKYGNCPITEFNVIGLTKENDFLVNFKDKNNKSRNIEVKLKGFEIPDIEVNNQCEAAARDKILRVIKSTLISSVNKQIILKNCHITAEKTTGIIYIEDSKMVETLIAKKLLVKSKPWWKFGKSINWCSY